MDGRSPALDNIFVERMWRNLQRQLDLPVEEPCNLRRFVYLQESGIVAF